MSCWLLCASASSSAVDGCCAGTRCCSCHRDRPRSCSTRLAPKCSRNVNFAGRKGGDGAWGPRHGTNRTPSLSLCFLICKTGMRLLAWNSRHDSTNTCKCPQSDSPLLAAGDSAPNERLPLSLRCLTSSPGVLPPGSVDLEAFHGGFQGPQAPQTFKKVCFSGQGVWGFHQIHRPSSNEAPRPSEELGGARVASVFWGSLAL